jgi:hypothetical protein
MDFDQITKEEVKAFRDAEMTDALYNEYLQRAFDATAKWAAEQGCKFFESLPPGWLTREIKKELVKRKTNDRSI